MSGGANRWNASGDLLLGLGVLMAWTQKNDTTSALVALLWLVLRLVISPGSRNFNWVLILILLLNLRGVVLHEGTKPFSHIEYIVLIAALVAGVGRTLQHWQASLVAIAAAGVIGFIFNLTPLVTSLQAIWSGQAALPGYPGPDLGRSVLPGRRSERQPDGFSLRSDPLSDRHCGDPQQGSPANADDAGRPDQRPGGLRHRLPPGGAAPPLLVGTALALTRRSPSGGRGESPW